MHLTPFAQYMNTHNYSTLSSHTICILPDGSVAGETGGVHVQWTVSERIKWHPPRSSCLDGSELYWHYWIPSTFATEGYFARHPLKLDHLSPAMQTTSTLRHTHIYTHTHAHIAATGTGTSLCWRGGEGKEKAVLPRLALEMAPTGQFWQQSRHGWWLERAAAYS